MKIQFIGAAHEVTGSCTMLTVCGKHYLVDCGMEQGKDIFQNVSLPVKAVQMEAVFLTHAHIDHSGMLPKLYRDGFRGPIYATNATADLCNIMLRDSAHIQESEAQWQQRKAARKGETAPEPVYTMADAEGAIGLFRPCAYGQRLQVGEGVQMRLSDMGHLLGSACVELWLTEAGQSRKIVFSGDVGNTNQAIIRDPQTVTDADYVVVESTYGNRLHQQQEHLGDPVLQLADYIQRTMDRGGNVIIPSFAVGRTQEMLYAIREIKQKGLVKGHPGFAVYVDSPLAVEATAIFMQCDNSCLDNETLALVKQGINPIWFDGIHLSVTSDDSKAINEDTTPKVILSASGMCEAGRIRHHLKHNLWRQNSTVLFVGYQAEGSLGRKLQDGAAKVKLFGEEILVRAEIGTLRGTSGHADRDGLLNWIHGFRQKPRGIFVNHGDPDACEAFRELLNSEGYAAQAPYSGGEYDLLTGELTVYAEGVPVIRKEQTKESQRADGIYRGLVAAAQDLLKLAIDCKGKTNKDNAKFTDQIRNLIQKWSK